ncbi:DUF2306 domain-containing protein [Virgibacillus sp. YIM 98842]|uniref:DUF2306 domain-containing protein n=1 Tax=Virgibacillus sp. YIM 98842 TaxID=2663533 RepID=UPI0013DD0E29|nr:DUF2306 domain-containing protein [Virgibacillus sp. YIM 98842]
MITLSIITHVAAGFIALIFLWLPLLFKKGGRYHRLTGWVFTGSMFMISGTSIHLALYRIWFEGKLTTEEFSFYLFLMFIAVLSFTTAMYGLRVLRFKKHAGKHREWIDWFLPVLLFTSAVLMSIYGWMLGDQLLTWFPLLGVFLALSHMTYWWRRPDFKLRWRVEHLTGMLSCGISTVTAFVVFGAPRIFALNQASVWLWFAPAIVLVPLIIYLSVKERYKYQRQGLIKQGVK